MNRSRGEGEEMNTEELTYNDKLHDAIEVSDSVKLLERYKSGQISATEALQRMDELFKLMEQ